MARRRCTKTGPYEMSRSRMRYRGAWSQGKASVIWREIHSAVGFSVTPNDSQIRRPCRMMTRHIFPDDSTRQPATLFRRKTQQTPCFIGFVTPLSRHMPTLADGIRLIPDGYPEH